MCARWRGRCDRRAAGDVVEPIAQLRVPRPPMKIGNASVEPEGTGERDLRQVEGAAHQRMVDFYLPEVGHPFTAVCFVWRTVGDRSFWGRRSRGPKLRDRPTCFAPGLRGGVFPMPGRLANQMSGCRRGDRGRRK